MSERKPLSKEEIAAKIAAARAQSLKLREERASLKLNIKHDSEFLKGEGYSIIYVGSAEHPESRIITYAIRYNKQTGKGKAYFAIKSYKDQFSRPEARRVLVKHVLKDTHTFDFHCEWLMSIPGPANQQELHCTLIRGVVKQIELHPEWFPTHIVKSFLANPEEFSYDYI